MGERAEGCGLTVAYTPTAGGGPGRPLSFVVRGSSPRGGCGSEASSDLALHGAPLAWGPGRAAQACGGVCGGGAPGPDGLASGSARGLGQCAWPLHVSVFSVR